MKILMLTLLFALTLPVTSFAHGGRTASDGCHNNRKAGVRHCHSPKASKKIVRTKARASARTQSRVLSNDKDCPDFSTQHEAQMFFVFNGGPINDPHRLDKDKDGIACESNPT